MIISVDELREYVTTDMTDKVLEVMLQALELSIREHTNNNFQARAYRSRCDIVAGTIVPASYLFSVNDTIQISETAFNKGLYVIKSVDNGVITVDKLVIDEPNVLITKVEYPADVVLGVVNIIKWQLKNEAANSGDTSKKDIQSETISRHSVTYATDTSETDIDERFGVPKKYVAFLTRYTKARF